MNDQIIEKIGDQKVIISRDGNAWCAVREDFINLQESPAGFGETIEEAVYNLVCEPTYA